MTPSFVALGKQPKYDKNEEDVDETNVSSDVEERGAKFDSGRVHDVLVGHSEDNVSEGNQMRRKEL